MSTRTRYERPDGAVGVANMSLATTIWSTNEVTASLASWSAGERIRHYRLPSVTPSGIVYPVGIEALRMLAKEAELLWSKGMLR